MGRANDAMSRCTHKAGSLFRLNIYRPGFVAYHSAKDKDVSVDDMEGLTPTQQLEQDCAADNAIDNVTVDETQPSLASKLIIWNATTLPASSPYLNGVQISGAIAVSLKPSGKADPGNYEPAISDCYQVTTQLPLAQQSTASFVCSSGVRNEYRSVLQRCTVCILTPKSGPLVLILSLTQGRRSTNSLLARVLKFLGLLSIPRMISLSLCRPFHASVYWIEPSLLHLCLAQLDKDDLGQFSHYFPRLFFSMGVISAPAGSGKSHLAAVIASISGFS